MGTPQLCAACLLAFSLSLSLQPAFTRSNLDATEPIVRFTPAGDEDEFGMSVVMHQVVEPVTGDFESFLNNTRLIVGAPTGTYPGGLSGLPPLDPINRTGLVYLCPVRSPGNCTGLLSQSSDPANDDRRLFDGDPDVILPVGFPERKQDQLMGSFLASTGDYFLACAPRWVLNPTLTGDLDQRRPIGRCFYSPRDLQNFTGIQSCSGTSVFQPLGTSDNQCLTGFSGAIFDQGSTPAMVLSLVGESDFNGRLVYYDVQSAPPTEIVRTEISVNAETATLLYEGYSVTTGSITSNRFTNSTNEDIISGVPRFDGNILNGGVRIRSQTDLSGPPVIPILEGSQTGEYFGAEVAAADLNNDGYDELIVGAPIYSTGSVLEVGRVFIYENTGGSLNRTAIILTGALTTQARFGTTIVNLGDINGDDFEDIAISAPFEVNSASNNTGVVYIHYGASSEDGLISRIADQVIRADSIVETVPDVTSLRSFGFSMASELDVDGNMYNDLFIGAFESQTAVLIRSLSVANITVSMTTDVEMVIIDTIGSQGSSFEVTVCASYNGRGLDNRPLDTTLEVSEVVSNNAPRLNFTSNEMSAVMPFSFTSTDTETCVNVSVFVRPVRQLNTAQVDFLLPLVVSARFQPIPRVPPVYVGGDPVDLIDYRTVPVFNVGGNTSTAVLPTVNCPLENGQEVCRPDLTVTLESLTYLNSEMNTIPGNQAVANEVDTVRISLSYTNIGDDPAFGSLINFTLSERFSFVQAIVPAGATPISCQRVENGLEYNCDLPNYIPPGQVNELTLVWRLTQFITGREPDEVAPVSITLTSTRDMETNVTNNDLINGPLVIEYAASSDLDIQTFSFTQTPSTYRGIPPTANPTVDDIGQRVQLTLMALNRGPSDALNAELDIYIPTNTTENRFFLYLVDVTNPDGNQVPMMCDRSSLNPQGLTPSTTTSRRARRSLRSRSARLPRQVDDEEPQPVGTVWDCSDPSDRIDSCSLVRCSIPRFNRFLTATVVVTAALDERFFQFETGRFTFIAYATIRNTESFITDEDLSNNRRTTPEYSVEQFVEPESSDFPIWIPIVCAIVAIILIIILFIVLLRVGFFRRKKHQEQEEDADADGDFVPPAQVEPVDIPDFEDEKEPDDIGDTDDLENSGEEKKEGDPDETSL